MKHLMGLMKHLMDSWNITYLNENALDREIDFADERDVMEQEIGGYGGISSGSTSSFENYPEIA